MNFSTVYFNKTALLDNLNKLPCNNICAMVKANAYGLGIEDVCKTLSGKVSFFGVATLQEALKVREIDKTTPILIVGVCENLFLASKNNISITIESEEMAKKVIKFSQKLAIKIHLKINTGMNRFGIKNKKILKKIIKKLKNNKKIIIEGVFTHFYFTENTEISLKQLKKFNDFLTVVPENAGIIYHIGGSGVLKGLPKEKTNKFMIRVGIDLYEKVITIKSKIIKMFTIKKGENLGYSGGFVASKKTRVGIVPLGYADGINRALKNKAFVSINGELCRIIGNVCMDVFFVELNGVQAKIFDEVVVFENALDWAKLCHTIPYEILTNLNFSRMEKVVF
jgi:alanine racemase